MPATSTDRIDGLTTSVAVKAPCRVASTVALTLSGLQTVNGVALADGDRVLVKNQVSSIANGIYVARSSAWERAKDYDGARDVVDGTLVVVKASGSDVIYKTVCSSSPVVVGSSAVTFTLAAFGDSSSVAFLQAGTGASARTLQDKGRDFVSPEDFGAAGNGVADDSTALASALATGKNVKATSGKTYLINGGLAMTTAGQVLDMTGATMKLKTSAGTKGMLTVSAINSRVIGGSWDGNKANNGTGDPYGHFAVLLTGEGSTVDAAYSFNSFGIGFKGSAANKLTVSRCRVEAAELFGIYIDGTGASDFYHAKIVDNIIDVSTATSAGGIYLTGQNSPFTFEQKQWNVSRNIVKCSTTATAGITVRGYEGICHGNQVTGSLLQISVDIARRCVISGNRCSDPGPGTSAGLEVNGAYNAITGNFLKGQTYGILSSGNDLMDGMTITGNVFETPGSRGIYVLANVAGTARYLNISGNTFIATAGVAMSGVYLARDCKYSLIQGNVFHGPGSGIGNGRGVFLDSVNGDVAILANRFDGWEKPLGLYNPAAVAQINVSFIGNDCSRDMGADTTWMNLEGLATYGTGCVQSGNATSGGGGTDYFDRANNRFVARSNAFATPAGNVVAGIGSIWINTNGGAATTFFVKESSSATSTGWAGK